jgi:hypothetical protein
MSYSYRQPAGARLDTSDHASGGVPVGTIDKATSEDDSGGVPVGTIDKATSEDDSGGVPVGTIAIDEGGGVTLNGADDAKQRLPVTLVRLNQRHRRWTSGITRDIADMPNHTVRLSNLLNFT